MNSRLRTPAAILTTFALAVSGISLASLPARAAGLDELVVVSIDTAGGTGLATPSLVTVNVDGTPSTAPTVALPAAAVGANKPFTLSGGSSAQGYLKLSADKRYLTLPGYAGAPGSFATDPKDSLAADLERVVARVDNTGTADTSTGLGAAFGKSHARSAVTADGSSFYVTGSGADGTPAAGVIKVDLGGANATAISGAWANTRVVDIADGNLYATSDKTPVKGIGTWPGLPSASSAPIAVASIATGTPTDLALLDLDPAVPGVDTAYVIVEGATGILKFTSNGSTWTARGSRAIAAQSLTGRVTNGDAELFVVEGSAAGNRLVTVTDTAEPQTVAAFGTATTLTTATGTTALRGVAFAPTGWAPVGEEEPGPVNGPTLTFGRTELAGTVGRTDNPTTTFTVADEESAAADIDVVVTSSSNTAVADVANVTITGTGAERTVSVQPKARGYRAVLTFTATDEDGNATTASLTYSASSEPPSTTGFYYYGASDTSTIVEAGDGYILTANDENQTIGLYEQGVTAYPVKQFTFAQIVGAEIDIEGADRIGNTIYWTGSHGNSRSGGIKVDRRTVFTTTVTGSGSSTELTFGSSFTGLWSQLRAWDASNGHGLGADYLGFVAGTAEGELPNPPAGFNIEALEFAPGDTTAYLGFRAPSIEVAGEERALIVPVENLPALIAGDSTQAAFGAPILLDLGGRTIRSIAKNAANQYLISAGPGGVENSWALYTWDGDPLTAPQFNRVLPDTDAATTGSWESIAPLPATLGAGSVVELIADTGDATLYNASENKDLNPNIQKAFADTFTLTDVAPTVIDFDAAVTGSPNVGSTLTATTSALTPSGVTLSYQWLRSGKAITGATAQTHKVSTSDLGKKLSVRIVATKLGLAPVTVTTSSTAIVGKRLVVATGVPTITGIARVGTTLAASSTPVVSTPSATTRTFQWFANGTAISGAKSSKFTVTAATLGKTLTVRVTLAKSGYASATAWSAATDAVAQGILVATKSPRITGTTKVGSTLVATGLAWNASSTSTRYYWYAAFGAGEPELVQVSTSSRLALTWQERGAVITVEARGAKAGYTSAVSARSAGTAVIR